MFTLPDGIHKYIYTSVKVLDEKHPVNGAYHKYLIADIDDADCEYMEEENPHAMINFQRGPVKVAGKNGCFIEDLLDICRHRLECFQASDFACAENAEALDYIAKAMEALNRRTRSRQQRGVEGTNQL